MTDQEDNGIISEPKLSFITLSDDMKSIKLNDNPDYSLPLPLNLSKRKDKDKLKILIEIARNGCNAWGLDYVSDENLTNAAKEVVSQLTERKKVAKRLTVPEVLAQNSGRVETRAKIVGVSADEKLILKEIRSCPICNYSEESKEFQPPRNPYKPSSKECPNKCEIGNDQIDLNAQYDYINARSITVQEPDAREDLVRLRVILLQPVHRDVRVGEIATIGGDVYVKMSGSGSGGKLFAVLYANKVKYEREEERPITEKDIEEFKKFAQQPNVIDKLVESFAPNVIGHQDAKLGILRSAVSVREDKHITGVRSRTHTLLAGDPGTAKSMLAEEGTKIVPNSRYVTAEHISIKSVLAIIDKEADGSRMLMLGAVPQAKNALCVLNELGSMIYDDQQHFADILEEGRFTKDQYGIYQEVSSPTTIIATTNPEGGYWNRSVPPSLEQIPIKSNIRDRFDQFYIFEDFQTTEECREYTTKKTQIYQNPQELKIDYSSLKRYLQYAASIPAPVLTPEAGTMLSDFWIRMRDAGRSSNRSFDSLIRIARDQARLHLKQEIDVQIVNEVTKDVQLMYMKMGMRVDPSVENPIDIATNEIIKYVNTLSADTSIALIEAIRHVWHTNNSIRQYLGGGNDADKVKWSISENKRLRHIHERFSDGAEVGKTKIGRGVNLAVVIKQLNPLVIAKLVRETEKGEQQEQQQGQISTSVMWSNWSSRSNDQNDHSDLMVTIDDDDALNALAEVVKKVMRNKQDFNESDWVITFMLEPIQNRYHCTQDQALQMLHSLIQEGKIEHFEPGKFRPVWENWTADDDDIMKLQGEEDK